METSARLYTLNYNEAKTYMWAAIFVACNLVLPVMAFKDLPDDWRFPRCKQGKEKFNKA